MNSALIAYKPLDTALELLLGCVNEGHSSSQEQKVQRSVS